MNATNNIRNAVTAALRTARAAEALKAGGVRISYNFGYITVAGDTYPLRAVLADAGFRFVRYGQTCEWRWKGPARQTPNSHALHTALRRAQACA